MNRSNHSTPSRATKHDGIINKLSYSEMATDETGMVIPRETKVELRKQHGYCITCPHSKFP